MDVIDKILPPILDGEDKTSPFANCIRKNYRHIKKWARRTQSSCFRIYDRHMHHYPLAIDFYNGKFCVHYFLNRKESEASSLELIEETNRVLSSIFGCTSKDIFWRSRIKRKKVEQYEKVDTSGDFFTVYEFGIKFKVNLIDYLDTGLFLDHRETRRVVSTYCKDKKMLNLFAYTCAFSIHAAKAGAKYTKSVDLSNTYLAWGRENFILNDLNLQTNDIVRADCLKFLDEEIKSGIKYDIIVIDPPTISRSKKMDQLFDVQEDYISLITKSLNLLNPNGIIFFSTNLRKFVFDERAFINCTVFEISEKTLPIDFHDPKIHRCWKIMN